MYINNFSDPKARSVTTFLGISHSWWQPQPNTIGQGRAGIKDQTEAIAL